MILILVFGYVVAYMILFMMWIAFMAAVALSFGAYVIGYLVNYAWQAARFHKTPDWRYNRKAFVVDQEKVGKFATGAGIGAMVGMVVGFFIWALTGSLLVAGGWVGGLSVLAGFILWDNSRAPKRLGDRPTYGEIRDKHGV